MSILDTAITILSSTGMLVEPWGRPHLMESAIFPPMVLEGLISAATIFFMKTAPIAQRSISRTSFQWDV